MVDSNNAFLKEMTYNGLSKRGINSDCDKYEEYLNRLTHELNIVEKGNLADFFLNTAFGCLKMKSNNILLGMGRGSAAGSLIAYCLKITEIDPIEHDLKFERFLNETRLDTVSSADIDIDIPRDKRQDVLSMYKDDFGRDKSYQVINKLKWTKKTAIDDLGRISGIPFDVRKRISKLIGDSDPTDVQDVVDYLNKYPFIRENYLQLTGMIKSYGIHAGGLIILDKPVEYHDSILRINGVDCLDNDGKTCDSLGYLKQDLLGINTLTIVSDCLELLSNKIKLPSTFDDKKVFETINQSTLGLFQIEAAGANQVCQELKPSNFEELTALLAICRPGAVDSGDKDRYINRKHGIEKIEYDHPNLEPILKNTYGCIIYQEDLMNVVTEFAGMTPVDSDNIRRGVGKKIQAVFDEYYPKFIDACIKQGVEKKIAEIIWSKMEASASYSFNKSHAVSYAALTYITAWLKTYYPVEFLLSVLDNTDDENKRIKIYNELQSLNKEIVNPNINKSKEITVEDEDNIYLSFNLIKGIGLPSIEKIIASQPYNSFEDFCKRSKVNKTVKIALIECGAFDCFNLDRCDLYNNVQELPKTKKINTTSGEVKTEIVQEAENWNDQEKLFREFQRIKINPRGNVLDLYDLNQLNINIDTNTIATLKENVNDYKNFFVKALVSDYKAKDDYAYLSITDGFDVLSVFVGKEFVPRYVKAFEVGNPLLLHLSGKGSKYSLLSLINLQNPTENQHEYWLYTGEALQKLKRLQKANSVPCGIARNVKYFTSKKGNPCVRYDLQTSDDVILLDRIKAGDLPLMCEGSYVFFLLEENETFLNILEVH